MTETTQQLSAVDQRFADMRDLWRAELRGVEQVAAVKVDQLTRRLEILDARLKHLEERK
jgi:hypothetical protein